MSYISSNSPFYSPPDLTLKYQPFNVGEKVKPHFNFGNYYHDVKECTIKTCEKGFCQTGWLVTVEEFTRTDLGKQEFDSSWFFKLKN